MGRKRGSRNASAGTAAATAKGAAAAETVQEAVSASAQDAAGDTAGNQPAGDRPVAEAGAAGGGDGPGNQLGDVSQPVAGALEGAAVEPEAVAEPKGAQDAAGAAGQEATAQSQQAGPAQEEVEELSDGEGTQGTAGADHEQRQADVGQAGEGSAEAAGAGSDAVRSDAPAGDAGSAESGEEGGEGSVGSGTAVSDVGGGEKATTFEARQFTKRSVTISAMPTDGTPESNRAVIDWTRGSSTPAFMEENGDGKEQLSIVTREGTHWVTPGDWIVRGIKGEHYPVKPEIFDATYDVAPEDEGEEITFRTPLGLEELARGVGAAARLFANTWTGGEVDIFDKEEAAIMADFVRANPDAPPAAMFTQLVMKKRYERTTPTFADELVLSLFHSACLAVFKFEEAQAAEAAAKAFADTPAASWPGEKAMKPADAPFAPTGFSPR